MIVQTALVITLQFDHKVKQSEIQTMVEKQSLNKKLEIRWWEDPNYVPPQPSDYEDCFETNLKKLLDSFEPNPWQNLDFK